MLELPHPFEDMGSQLLRKALDELSGRVGDGAATCSVLTHALLDRACPLLAAGHHPVSIIEGLQAGRGLGHRGASPAGTGRLTIWRRFARWYGPPRGDEHVALLIAEILDTIGAEGSLVVEETRHVGLAHEYVQGGRWGGGQASPSLMADSETQILAQSPAILVSAVPLTAARQLVSLLERVATTDSRNVMLIAPAYSDEVIGLLVVNRQHAKLNTVIAVKAPRSIHYEFQILEDISAMMGGRLFLEGESDGLQSLTADDLGRATHAWVSRSAFGIVGGSGDREKIGRRVRAIRAQARAEADPVKRRQLSERAGNLTGLSALVRVEMPIRGRNAGRQDVEKAAAVARQALLHGVVVGGGAALASCADRVRDQFVNTPQDLGAAVLSHALAEPIRVILENAGVPPGPIVQRLRTQRDVQAYDVLTGKWDSGAVSELIDPWPVVEAALEAAVSTATMVLSTDVLVRTRKPLIPVTS